ncbi:MAG: HK97 family phage prohead protease [Eubacteriales bacterium]|nr:HK97 family phage prohead protease [Eubacteriales bacterium]
MTDANKAARGEGRQYRSFQPAQFRALETDGKRSIEAYFAVFGDVYEIWPGATESFDPHAFDGQIAGDVRCLVDHEPSKVLGRTKAGTLSLSIDSYGLKGVVEINERDQDAMNLYARVQRGDVSQCSVGFDILREDYTLNPDGTQHWTIREVKLYEGSIVTFPAYEKTEAVARSFRMAQSFEFWKKRMKERMQVWH